MLPMRTMKMESGEGDDDDGGSSVQSETEIPMDPSLSLGSEEKTLLRHGLWLQVPRPAEVNK